MKINIFKKLIATLCAVIISISIITPTKAVQLNDSLAQSNIYYRQNANESIHSCLEKLEIIRNNLYTSVIYIQNLSINSIINSSIDNLTNKLNKIYYLETQDLLSLKNTVMVLNDLNTSLNSLLKLTKNNINLSIINDELVNANSTLDQIYEDLYTYDINTKINHVNTEPTTNNLIFNNITINNNYTLYNEELLEQDNEKWWDQAESELDTLIAESESYIKKRNIQLYKLCNKFENINAGLQSKNNCWLFTSQNIANYFLFMNGQTPIKKFDSYEFNESTDIIENEFLKRMPKYAYILRNAQSQYEMRQYLQTYGISVDEISISNNKPNYYKHTNIMKKIAYLLLIWHFSYSDTPIATNIGYHWITVAGIDINKKQALILNSLNQNPEIKTLDEISELISTQYAQNKNKCKSHILILFPHKSGFDCIAHNDSYQNWNVFKSEILAIARK